MLFYIAEANAIVSTGSLDKVVELPAMDKVIGPYEQIKIFPFSPARLWCRHAALCHWRRVRCHDGRGGYLGTRGI